MKRVVVTGAGGFIGTRLLGRLASLEDVRVCAVLRHANPALVAEETAVVDLRAEGFEAQLPEAADVLVHLAASHASLEDGSSSVPEMIRLHVDTVSRLMAWAVSRGVKHVVMVSTTAVLAPGDVSSAPLAEDAPCVGVPSHPYALSRRQGEEVAHLYASALHVTVLRPSLVYGPGQSEESTMGRMGESLVMGEQVPLHRPDGHQVTPVYVEDVVDVLGRLVLESPETAGFEVLHVAGPEHLSEGALARSLAAHLHEPLAFESLQAEGLSYAVSCERLDARYPDRQRTPWSEGLVLTWR